MPIGTSRRSFLGQHPREDWQWRVLDAPAVCFVHTVALCEAFVCSAASCLGGQGRGCESWLPLAAQSCIHDTHLSTTGQGK